MARRLTLAESIALLDALVGIIGRRASLDAAVTDAVQEVGIGTVACNVVSSASKLARGDVNHVVNTGLLDEVTMLALVSENGHTSGPLFATDKDKGAWELLLSPSR